MDENTKQRNEDNLRAHAANLAALVEYGTDSVVSRTIMKKEAGTVTLFAFEKGEGLSVHTTPYDALVFVIDGEAEITISGNPLNVKAGEVVIMPAGEPHAVHAVKRFKMILVMIRDI